MKQFLQRRREQQSEGQALVEYIIIVVIVAIAAIAVVGVFSETVQGLWGGAAEQLGADSGAVDSATGVPDLQDINSNNN